ncbi:hypothetical protein F1188_07085 [Roseospira marina]|uniref:Outer membrane beta-barrel protein n=1 Tax=Roseospira marina TaxID=140057 RepID=A0A5M6ID75_9PROT|nr:hypothetical protein [Roseospira marina]KAA5606183.1 hypothetical protein F1188_07085 [Roseospira marina]MBB4314327.1 hypothetical protein [Roseospira marina]MBB5087487.1 hypothetical protein [Roseospira marina]
MKRSLTAAGVGLLGAAVVAVSPAWSVDLTLDQAVETQVIATDNVDLEPDEDKDGAIINRVDYNTAFSAVWRRMNVTLDAGLGVETENGRDPTIDQDIRAAGALDFIPTLLGVEANASSRRVLIDDTAPQTEGRANSDDNTETVNTVEISPYARYVFVDDIEALARFRHRETLKTDTSDSDGDDGSRGSGGSDREREMQQTLTVDTRSQLRWVGFQGEFDHRKNTQFGGDSRNDGAGDFEETTAGLTTRVPVTRWFTAIGQVGYGWVEAKSEEDLTGIFWNAGGVFEGAHGTLSMTYGRRYGDQWIEGDMTYAITPRLRVQAAISRALETSMGRASRLEGEERTRGEDSVLPQTSRTSGDNDDGVSLAYTGQFGVVGNYRRNTYSLTGAYTNREYVSGTDEGEDETSVSLTGGWNRTLNREWTSSLTLRSQHASGSDTDESLTLSARGRLTYLLTDSASLFGGASHAHRFSDDPEDEYTENTVFIGGRLAF